MLKLEKLLILFLFFAMAGQLKASHPKLYCQSSDRQWIENKIATGVPKEIWDNLLSSCDYYINNFSWNALNNDEIRYHGQIAGQMAFAYWLDNSNNNYKTTAINICLNNIVGHVDNMNNHMSLQIESAIFALSTTYDFLYSELSQSQKEKFKNRRYLKVT